MEELGVAFRRHWSSDPGPDLKLTSAAGNVQLSEPATSQDILDDRGAVSAEPSVSSSGPVLPYQQRQWFYKDNSY